MLQLITTSSEAGSCCAVARAFSAAERGKSVGILLAHRDSAFVDPGQPFQIDVGVVACGRHQFVRREMSLGQMSPGAR